MIWYEIIANRCVNGWMLVDADVHQAEPSEHLQERPVHALLPLLHEVRQNQAAQVWVGAASRLVHPGPEHEPGGRGTVDSWGGRFVLCVHHSKWLSLSSFKSFHSICVLLFFFSEKLCYLGNHVQCQILLLQKWVDMHHMTFYNGCGQISL